MATLFITSTGFSHSLIKEEFLKRANRHKASPVGIITTAAEGKALNKYSKLAESQFQSMGFTHTRFIDVESESPRSLTQYSIIYTCGGNTFRLLDALKKSGGDTILKDILKNEDVVYVGVSAGSIILSPTIRIADTIEPDPNEVGLKDLSALGVVPFEIYPHYSSANEEEIIQYENNFNTAVERITDEQALLFEDGHIKRLG